MPSYVAGPRGKAPRWVRRQREQRKHGQKPYFGFYEKEQAGLALASWDHFSRFWGMDAGPGCLVLGPGVIKTGK